MFATCKRELSFLLFGLMVSVASFKWFLWHEEDVAFELTFKNYSNPSHGFQYSENSKPFFQDLESLIKAFRLDRESIDQVNDERVLNSRPRLLTAVSENHFFEVAYLLRSIQRVFQNDSYSVVLYDLGLKPSSAEQLHNNYSFVTLKTPPTFNSTIVKNTFRNLLEYRWKPLLIVNELMDADAVMWLDASTFFHTNAQRKLNKIATAIRDGKSYPVQLFEATCCSTYSVTDPQIYEYFPPGGATLLKRTLMYGANIILVYATKRAREEIIRWWLLCALEAHCMSPPGAKLPCKFGDRMTSYAKCHRFDQSALNLLLGLAASYNTTLFTTSMLDLVGVNRIFIDRRQFE